MPNACLQHDQPFVSLAELPMRLRQDTEAERHAHVCAGRGNGFNRIAHFPDTVLQFSLLGERPANVETGCSCQERQFEFRGYLKLLLRRFAGCPRFTAQEMDIGQVAQRGGHADGMG